ncbi:MAG: transporter substrate-binding domain-containing protein [Thermodesulfobacteriota bacterium]|nr:transporter substrate-binding domain-containing protein [Thermodesulfobacteriota bacterium]
MKKLLVIVASVFLISVQPLLSAELTILTENLPPLNYLKDGVLVGPSVEIVKEIQGRVGSHEQIKVYPWVRAYKMALEEENVVLFGMTYSKARYDKFKWVGPLATKRDILVAKKGSGLKISSLEDAKKVKRIGTLRDDTRGRLLKSLGFTNLEPVSDEQQNAKKLVLGRIDLWTYKKPGLKTVCELAGVDYNEIEEVYHLRKIDLMIAFSKKTSDSIVQNWRNAFNEMLADGTIMQIRKKWNRKLEDNPFPEIKD